MSKQATPDHPIHDLVAGRWSPYAFADRPVATDDIRSILEAARWAASSYNEQPWSYIVATKDDGEDYGKLLACLVPPAGMQHIEEIASHLEKMPAKSTYFYPKLLSGLVINPLDA